MIGTQFLHNSLYLYVFLKFSVMKSNKEEKVSRRKAATIFLLPWEINLAAASKMD